MCVGGNQLDISVFTTLHVDDDYNYTVKRDFMIRLAVSVSLEPL